MFYRIFVSDKKIMFRKITHIIISIVLLISTTGVSLSEHHCGNEIINISLNTTMQPCCEMPNDCCHNDFELIQMKADFTKPSSVVQIDISELHHIEFPALIIPLNEFADNCSTINTDKFFSPDKHSILLKYQSFLL